MGETPPSSVGGRGTPSASNASATGKNGGKGEKRRASRVYTEEELLKEFTGLLADGASAAKALGLAKKIIERREGATHATDDGVTGDLIKRTVKEALAEYGLVPQGQAKGGTTYAAVARQGVAGAGLTRNMHAPNVPNAPKVIPARHGKEIIVKVGEAGEDILRRAPADTVQALGNITKRRDAASARRLPSGDVAITFTGSNQWWLENKSAWLERVFGPAAQISARTYPVMAKGLPAGELRRCTGDDLLKELKARNEGKGVTRAHTRLPRDEQATRAMLLIETSTPHGADGLVKDGLLFNGGLYDCEPYDASLAPVRCYKCLHFGHVAARCKAAHARCATCGGTEQDHPDGFRGCRGGEEGRRLYCVVCKGRHLAFDRNCPAAQEQYMKSKVAYQNRALGFDLTRVQATAESQGSYPPPTSHEARVLEKRRGRPPKRPRGEEEQTEIRGNGLPTATLDSFFLSLPSSIPSTIQATQLSPARQPTAGLGGNNESQDL
jgi:hypothetical protein